MLSKNGNGSLSLIPETLGAQDSDTGLCVVIDESPDSSPSPETSGKGNHRGKTDVQLILFSKGNEGVDECPIHLTPGALEKSQDHLELHRDFYNLDDDVMHMIDHFHHREASSSAALTCASSSNALNSQQKMPAQKGKPVLHQTLASMISSASTMTRMSLRLATFSIDAVFTSLKYSAHFGFGMSRKTLVSAVSVARNLHWLAIHQGADSGDALPFFIVLDRFTNASVRMIHSTFSLAELLTFSSLHMASSCSKFPLWLTEETVSVVDGLLGDTETSKALAAFAHLWHDIIKGRSEEMGYSNMPFGDLFMLGHIAKSLTTYCCLQFVTRRRWRHSIKLVPVYFGKTQRKDLALLLETTSTFMSSPTTISTLIQDSVEGEEQETYLKRSSSWAHSASGASSPRSENSTVTAGMASDQFPLVDPVPSEQQPLLKEEDLEMAEAMMKFSHERRRSLEDLDTDPEIPTRPTRRRCKTGPSVDQNEVKQLFKSFEKDQAQRRSENLTSDFSKQLQQELHQLQTDTANASGNMSGACQTLDTPTLTNPHLSFEDVQGLQSDIKTFMELAERYSKFAIGAYGTNFLKIMGIGKTREMYHQWGDQHHNHTTFAFHTSVPIEHIITSSFHDPSTLHSAGYIGPVHYVVVDASTSSVVVSLRGTMGFSDIVTDLTAKYVKYCTMDGYDGYVHSGMLKCADKIAKSFVKAAVIQALKKHPGFSLVLCGHSLGGGVASLLTLLWSREITLEGGKKVFVTNKEEGFPERPIRCFVYGPPAVVSAKLSKAVKNLITCFVYRNDVVPSLSIGLIRDFRNVTYNLWREPGIAESVMSKILGISRSKDTPMHSEAEELWCWALLKTLRADMDAEKLYPPGRVYWINARTEYMTVSQSSAATKPVMPTSSGEMMSMHLVEDIECAFSEFTFSSSMFTDHAPNNYEYAMQMLVAAAGTHQSDENRSGTSTPGSVTPPS